MALADLDIKKIRSFTSLNVELLEKMEHTLKQEKMIILL